MLGFHYNLVSNCDAIMALLCRRQSQTHKLPHSSSRFCWWQFEGLIFCNLMWKVPVKTFRNTFLQLQWGESPPPVGGVGAIIPRSSSASNKRIVTESFQHSTTLDCSGEAAISVNQWVLSARGLLHLRKSSRSRKLKNLIIMLQQKQPLCHNKKSPCDSHNNSLKFILKWDQRGRCCYFIAQHSKETF